MHLSEPTWQSRYCWASSFLIGGNNHSDDQDEINFDGGDSSVVCVEITHKQAQHIKSQSQSKYDRGVKQAHLQDACAQGDQAQDLEAAAAFCKRFRQS